MSNLAHVFNSNYRVVERFGDFYLFKQGELEPIAECKSWTWAAHICDLLNADALVEERLSGRIAEPGGA